METEYLFTTIERMTETGDDEFHLDMFMALPMPKHKAGEVLNAMMLVGDLSREDALAKVDELDPSAKETIDHLTAFMGSARSRMMNDPTVHGVYSMVVEEGLDLERGDLYSMLSGMTRKHRMTFLLNHKVK